MRSPFRPKLFGSLLSLALGFVVMTAVWGMAGCGSSPRAAAIEPAKNMYVIQNTYADGVESDSVLAMSTTATGATSPTATLQLPSGLVAFTVATGPDGEIYVGGPNTETSGEVLVYAPGASGAATPTATLTGGGTGTFTFPLYMTVDKKGQLYVFSADGSIESFAKGATSAASPVQYLTYDVTLDDEYSGIAVDDAGEIFVTDSDAGSVDVFAAGATGAIAPARSIAASSTGAFSDVFGLAVDGPGNVTLMNYNSADDPFGNFSAKRASIRASMRAAMRNPLHAHRLPARPNDDPVQLPTSIITFAAGASGTATPIRTLTGALTAINEPQGLALDGLDNLYYLDFEGGTPTLMTFAPTATGNVAPKASITSTVFTTSYFGALAAF